MQTRNGTLQTHTRISQKQTNHSATDMTPSTRSPQDAAAFPSIDRRHCFHWLAGALASLTATPSRAAKSGGNSRSSDEITGLPLHVLLIGNSTYARNAALRNPERDVALLEQAFGARGAKVRKLTNLTVSELSNAIPAFLDSIRQPPYALWISYSGHAVQINGRNYLQGIDSDFSTASRARGFGLELDTILGWVANAKPSAAVLSVDACRNNPFEPELTRGAINGLAAVEPRGLCVSFSTAPYMRALDGEAGQNSPYARALSNALAGSQSKSLDTILRETANTVYRNTSQKQVPEYRSSLRGEWWFDAGAVALRDVDATAVASVPTPNSTRTMATREVSYRPDEPPPPVRYLRMDAEFWAQLERRISVRAMQTGATQANELLARMRKPRPTEDERLVASVLLQDGKAGVQRDARKARQLLQPLANDGNAYAQTLLGESFYEDQIYDQAYKWLEIAARTGYGRAVTNLGQMQALGLSEQDPGAGAMRILEGLLKQSRANMPPPTQPTPADTKNATRLLEELLAPSKR